MRKQVTKIQSKTGSISQDLTIVALFAVGFGIVACGPAAMEGFNSLSELNPLSKKRIALNEEFKALQALSTEEFKVLDPIQIQHEELCDGFQVNFADYPQAKQDELELLSECSQLPAELNSPQKGLLLSGNAQGEELFMSVSHKIEALAPDSTYEVAIEVEFATNCASTSSSMDGNNGEMITIKAGALNHESQSDLDDKNFHRMNLEKGKYELGGKDMWVIGDASVENQIGVYEYKKLSLEYFRVKTDRQGNLWIVIGADSALEASASIYFSSVVVHLKEVIDPNTTINPIVSSDSSHGHELGSL